MTARANKETIEEIRKLSSSEDQDIATFFHLLGKTANALEVQSSFIKKLHEKKRKEIIEISQKNPRLAPVREILESMDSYAIGLAWPETDELQDSVMADPPYLTVRDAAYLLEIPPQQVRTYCEEGRLEASRTNNGRGEWRLMTGQFRSHEKYKQLLQKKYQEEEAEKYRRATLSEAVEVLSQDPVYQVFLAEEEDRRKRQEGIELD